MYGTVNSHPAAPSFPTQHSTLLEHVDTLMTKWNEIEPHIKTQHAVPRAHAHKQHDTCVEKSHYDKHHNMISTYNTQQNIISNDQQKKNYRHKIIANLRPMEIKITSYYTWDPKRYLDLGQTEREWERQFANFKKENTRS